MPPQDKQLRMLILKYARSSVASDARLMDLQFQGFRGAWVATVQTRKYGLVDVTARFRQGEWELEHGPLQVRPQGKRVNAYARAGADSPLVFGFKAALLLVAIGALIYEWPAYGPRVLALGSELAHRAPVMSVPIASPPP